MDVFSNLALGAGVAFSVSNLMFCFIGALLGTLIGVLPGIGPTATIAMLLPITYNLGPESALIMLAGIFYGAQYGGSTTAILVNLPGESSSVVTALDGYQMARQGKAGAALAIAAIGSFFAGSVATVLIAVVGPPLTAFAQSFGPPEYFSLMAVGLVAAIVLAGGSLIKAIAMVFLGFLLGLVGTDVETGAARMTFGLLQLQEGIEFVPLAMGFFGVSEILLNLQHPERRDVLKGKIHGLMPTLADLKKAFPAILRGTGLGSLLGVLPGGGATLSAFAAYTLEKRIAREPQRFGKGAIEGVAAPESANNAGAQTSFIPLLTLGIPSNAVMALMIGAMTIQGIIPGPQVMTERPTLFWGMIVSMWVGNLMLLVINLPLVGVWVKLLRVPYRLLFPAILFFCAIGAYSIHNSYFDVMLVALFGLVGYGLARLGFEAAPLIMGFVVGPLMEENLRRSFRISQGDPMVLLERPLSAALLMIAALLLLMVILPAVRRRREEVFTEPG
jgi:putative tricarboxylic transport membrane protein